MQKLCIRKKKWHQSQAVFWMGTGQRCYFFAYINLSRYSKTRWGRKGGVGTSVNKWKKSRVSMSTKLQASSGGSPPGEACYFVHSSSPRCEHGCRSCGERAEMCALQVRGRGRGDEWRGPDGPDQDRDRDHPPLRHPAHHGRTSGLQEEEGASSASFNFIYYT